MSILQSIILGIVQGLSEFLPISSSAHLIIIPWLLQWKEHTLAFDIALHLGTLLAIVIYFFKDYLNLIKNGFTKPKSDDGKLFWCIILATIPAGIFGFILQKTVEDIFRTQYLIIAIVLFVFGIIIFLVDKLMKKEKTLINLNFFHALLIGLCQALALFPGVSRSGITMTAGMMFGFKREESARFSFLLSGPVIFGAGIISFIKNFKTIKDELLYFVIGFLVSAIVGILAIHVILNYLKKNSFTPFVIYRIALALLILIVFFVR